MPLNIAQLNAIAKQVYQKFPELKGAAPVVQGQSFPGAKSPGADDRYVVTFKGAGRGAEPHNIVRVVRVTADSRGRVIKISTAR